MNLDTTKQFTILVFLISTGVTFLFIVKTIIERLLPIDGTLWLAVSFWIFFFLTLIIYTGHNAYEYLRKDTKKKKRSISEFESRFH